ncbi:MAG: hypothetical protein ACKERG_00875 [Candidatus Hodgkinia cicadicola]
MRVKGFGLGVRLAMCCCCQGVEGNTAKLRQKCVVFSSGNSVLIGVELICAVAIKV